jgi:hypothetical protein
MTPLQILTIRNHLRAAVMGEPVPRLGSGLYTDLMDALKASMAEDVPVHSRNHALMKVGLDTLEVLLERATAGAVAQRELGLLRGGLTNT